MNKDVTWEPVWRSIDIEVYRSVDDSLKCSVDARVRRSLDSVFDPVWEVIPGSVSDSVGNTAKEAAYE